ncbi:neuropeptide CCHamide-1 receptor-like [Diadema setosum]|uniref:neuropeptide CCHamide-1 receptor-like n=1 Tax=Diadema setosum TaxID=31175 RepID=UPI003B3A0F63
MTWTTTASSTTMESFSSSSFSWTINETMSCEADWSLHKIWGPFFLILVAIFGFMANLSLVVIVLRYKHLQMPPNILVLNLAIGDMVYLLVSTPFHAEHEIHACWQFGLVVCKLSNSMQVLSQGVCVYSLMAGSIERYCAIARPVRDNSNVSAHLKTSLVVVLIWVVSLALSIPILKIANMPLESTCVYLPHATQTAVIHETFRFAVMYVIPLFIIAFSYAKMSRTLILSTSRFSGERQPGAAQQLNTRRRIAIMLLTIAVFFGISWLPYFTYSLWFQYSFDYRLDMHIKVAHVFRQVRFILAFLNTCFNPVVVYLLSTSYRRALVHTLRCRPSCELGRDAVRSTYSAYKNSVVTAKKRVNNQNSGCYESTDMTVLSS